MGLVYGRAQDEPERLHSAVVYAELALDRVALCFSSFFFQRLFIFFFLSKDVDSFPPPSASE